MSDFCKCSHLAAGHYQDRRGRVVCSSAACGCAVLRLETPSEPNDRTAR